MFSSSKLTFLMSVMKHTELTFSVSLPPQFQTLFIVHQCVSYHVLPINTLLENARLFELTDAYLDLLESFLEPPDSKC